VIELKNCLKALKDRNFW